MSDYEKLKAQVQDCGECLVNFLVEVVDTRPELEEHAAIIKHHLEAFRRELDVLTERIRP